MTSPTFDFSLLNETTLQKEQRQFRENVARLRDAFLDRLFDLRPEKAISRARYLIVFFFLAMFFVSLIYYPPRNWVPYISDFYPPTHLGKSFTNLITFMWHVATNPNVLQYVPIFLASFFVALQAAAVYLADIFELHDIGVAHKFVTEVALTGSDETIRITQGDIFEEHRYSPNFLIGGPGKVVVDIDSVALFEKPDGTPRIIGPTGNEPGGKAILDGFERFRQAIDLRDHYIELRETEGKSSAVKSRSRDGIPITATDVQFMFSVQRGKHLPDDKFPYPFDQKAVERLVYRATSRVTPDLANPSTFEFSWINNMISLVRGKLGGFMNEHNLTVYLASIGAPEIEKAKQKKDKIAKQTQSLASSETDDSLQGKQVKPPQEFLSRHKVKKNLFDQFANEFTKNSREKGVELHWIGVGTWKTPIEIVPEKHLEAWLLTQDNLKNDSAESMKKLAQTEAVQKMKSLIEKVPLDAYENIVTFSKQGRRPGKQQPHRKREIHKTDMQLDDFIFPEDEMSQVAEKMFYIWQTMQGSEAEEFSQMDIDHAHDVQALLLEYRTQFQESADFIRDKNKPVHQNILDAVRYIDNQIAHWLGYPNT